MKINSFVIYTNAKVRLIIPLLLVALLVAIPQINWAEYVQSTITSKFIFFSFSSCTILTLFLIQLLFSKEISIRISKLDICLFLFLSYIIINRYVLQTDVGFSLRFLELIGLSVLYVAIRNLSFKSFYWILLAIVVSGIIQAVYGNLQLLGYYASNHSGFKMTGSFFNPGPYAGFLTSVWPIALGMYLFKEKVIVQVQSQTKSSSKILNKALQYTYEYIPLIGIVSMILVLPAAQSRAAWLAVIISSLILLELKYKLFIKYVNVSTVSRKVLLAIILSSVIGAGLFGIYHFKKGSSDGRLFIWKVTTEMIKEAPFVGVGFDRFQANYMNEQANYFAKNGETVEALVADNTYYAFNEFLQLLAENGIVGFLILIVIGIIIFKITVKEEYQSYLNITKVGLLAVAIFASFTYPLQIVPVKLILVVLIAFIASLDSSKICFSSSRNWTILFKTVIFIGGGVFLIKGVSQTNKLEQAFRVWKSAQNTYRYSDFDGASKEYATIYPIFKNNGEFLMRYGKSLSMAKNHVMTIEVLERAKLFLNTTIIETALGDSYKATKQYNKGEVAYQHAANMIPTRFYPNYLLAKLYDESGQKEQAVKKAQELMSKDVKIPSTAIKEMKVEMEKILKKYNKTSLR